MGDVPKYDAMVWPISAKGFTVTERARFHFRAVDQHRNVLAGMIGALPGRVTAVVSGQDQNVIFPHQLHQLRQTTVEQLQTRATGDIATMAP
jgi:hypothetical protein